MKVPISLAQKAFKNAPPFIENVCPVKMRVMQIGGKQTH